MNGPFSRRPRWARRIALAALCGFALVTLGAGVALAQSPTGPEAAGGGLVDVVAKNLVESARTKQWQIPEPAYPGALGNSKLAALMFWGLAGLTLAGALFVITRRNMISAVMGMVGTFFCIAALYAMLYAHFLAVIQILVYAGAIMVLFVFVIMILGRAEEQPWAIRGLFGKGIAGVALLFLLARIGQVLWKVKDCGGEAMQYCKATVALPTPALTGAVDAAPEFGSTKALGTVLFSQYLFPFEAVSIVLLVAVVGAIAVARPSVLAHAQDDEAEPAAEGAH